MAEDDSSQEKTEEPTSRRLDKAREEGQAPRSKELTTTAILLAGTLGLYIFGPFMIETMREISRYNFQLERDTIMDPSLMFTQLGVSFYNALLMLAPLFVILLIAAIAGPISLGGWLLSAKAMAPKFSRMDPIAGIKRMFSLKSLVELFKALAKVAVILALALALLAAMEPEMLALATQDVHRGMANSLRYSAYAAIALSAATILIALVDVPFQIWDHTRKLKMSTQDIKDEMKDTEGKPEVKGRIRQLQREMANRRMMAAVPEADVIITNPTHYSVALKYNPDAMATPVLLAKGVDVIALKIREIAKEHKVEIIESPALARAVYHTTELDQEIPSGLYLAVAKVLAYVFQLRNYRRGTGPRPEYPRNITVPRDMQYD